MPYKDAIRAVVATDWTNKNELRTVSVRDDIDRLQRSDMQMMIKEAVQADREEMFKAFEKEREMMLKAFEDERETMFTKMEEILNQRDVKLTQQLKESMEERKLLAEESKKGFFARLFGK